MSSKPLVSKHILLPGKEETAVKPALKRVPKKPIGFLREAEV
jgi:hypothetical protein